MILDRKKLTALLVLHRDLKVPIELNVQVDDVFSPQDFPVKKPFD